MERVKAVDRKKWTKEKLQKAVEDVKNKIRGVKKTSHFYGIPLRTLQRHIRRSKQSIERPSKLRNENELRLAAHIKNIESIGLPLEQSSLQSIDPFIPKDANKYFYKISDVSMTNIQNNDESQAIKYLQITSTALIENNQAIQISIPESFLNTNEEAPSMIVQRVSLLPNIQQKVSKSEHTVKVLPSEINLTTRKLFEEKTALQEKNVMRDLTKLLESQIELKEFSEECSNENEHTCVECHEYCHYTTRDVIQCFKCLGWLHKGCTSYGEKCNNCGKIAKEKGKGKGKKTSQH